MLSGINSTINNLIWQFGLFFEDFRIASITLFGSTPGYRNTYITDINRVIESKSEVDPYKINKNDLSIKTIKVNDIVKITKELLSKGKS